MAEVTLKKGGGRYLKSGGQWIYDNEIEKVSGEFEPGDIVNVLDFDGYKLGKGYHQRSVRRRKLFVLYFDQFPRPNKIGNTESTSGYCGYSRRGGKRNGHTVFLYQPE